MVEKSDRVYKRGFPVEKELTKRKKFSEREVGLNHPDNNSFLRLNDQGDIEIFAAPGVGIVISGKTKSISLFADSIKLNCKEDGFKWNSYYFNYSASNFSEPTLVKINLKDIHTAQNGASYFLDTLSILEKEETQKPITITSENKFTTRETISQQKFVSYEDVSDLSFEQIGLLEAYSSSYSNEHIILILKYIRQGMSFDEAHIQASKETNE